MRITAREHLVTKSLEMRTFIEEWADEHLSCGSEEMATKTFSRQ